MLECYPAAPAVVRALNRETRLWECALGRWGVALVVMGFVSSIAEDFSEGSVVRVQGGFREQENVRGV